MKRKMVLTIGGLLVGVFSSALVLLTSPLSPAFAISCPDLSVCVEPLTHSNTDLDGLIQIDVTVDNTGLVTTLSVQLASVDPSITNTPLGIDQFFYNNSTTVNTVDGVDCGPTTGTGPGGGWRCNFNGGQADGFGSFLSLKNLDAGGTGGISSPIVFVLDAKVLEFAANSNGAEFAAHIRFSDGCSAWVSDGTVSAGSGGNPSGCTRVSEPSTLFLLGLGLAGLGYGGRMRWFNRRVTAA